MKRFFPVVLFLAVSSIAFGQTVSRADFTGLNFSLDLTKVQNDMLTVEMTVPLSGINQDTVIYRLPAMVPGTYKVYNFGRFTRNFKATDKNGNTLTADPLDINSWKIGNAKKLYKISYEVEDTWDTKQSKDFVFEPAGSNIQQDTNFVLNNHCFFGYFEGMTHNFYNVTITHPDGFYGSTGLSNVVRKGNVDRYTTENYMDLVDGPIMYCRPDTTHLHVGGADVLVSVYSPKKLVTSKFVADSLRNLLDWQRQYLGGTLPVKNYAFIIYLTDNPYGFQSHSYGALEHSYSSFYTLLETKQELIAQTVKDVAAHEFFHTLTPLSIHSYEIGDFDYTNPKMSQHLWMYEGLTEYEAFHVQAKYGTMSLDDFLQEMHEKMLNMQQYETHLSFTLMSKGCLDKYEGEYNNVYEKGALIAMCLDLELRVLSNGKYGTQDLMRDLSKKYGKDRSFVDDSLFSDIVKLTYPQVGTFLQKCVAGSDPLPFDTLFAAVGIEFKKSETSLVLDPFGGFGVKIDDKGQPVLYGKYPNDFSRQMEYEDDDIVVSVNGKKIHTGAAATKAIDDVMKNAKDGEHYVVKVKRFIRGKYKTVKCRGTLHAVNVTHRYVMHPVANPTPQQLALRKAWINK